MERASVLISCVAFGVSVTAVVMGQISVNPDTLRTNGVISIISGVCAFTTTLLFIEIWRRKQSEDVLMNSVVQCQQAIVMQNDRLSDVEAILMSDNGPSDDDDDDDDDGDDDQPPRGSDREIYYGGGRG
jgi:hypothetical protein